MTITVTQTVGKPDAETLAALFAWAEENVTKKAPSGAVVSIDWQFKTP